MDKTKSNWRDLYIDALRNGPNDSNMAIAKELVDNGFVKGCIHKMMDGSFHVSSWIQLTMEGKELLEKLETDLHRSSFKYRAFLAIGALFSWGVGMASSILLEVFKCT